MTETAELTTREAATPTFEANFEQWKTDLNQFATDVAQMPAGERDYPEWWGTDEHSETRQLVRAQIKGGGIQPSQVSEYFLALQQQAQIECGIAGREPSKDQLKMFTYHVGSEKVAETLRHEPKDGPLHVGLLDWLDLEFESNHPFMKDHLTILQDTYGLSSAKELLGVKDGFIGKIREKLMSEHGVRGMRFIDNKYEYEKTSWDQYKQESSEWVAGALVALNGVTIEEAREYSFAASVNPGDDEKIAKLLSIHEQFGPERIRRITAATGIVAPENYTVEQLERMEEFANDPEKFAESLKDHDVSVVMVNRVGDHNGVMRHTAENFDDGRRVLFFEISKISDIYRNMLKLRDVGIAPSTLIISAHGGEGGITIADRRNPEQKKFYQAVVAGRALVNFANSHPEEMDGTIGYSMHGMKGFARLVTEIMQPSRGIDDASEDDGRRKIIFQACHQADEVNVADMNIVGERITLGKDSVISRLASELAVYAGDNTKVDIYGAENGIQMKATSDGVRYTGQPSMDSEVFERTELHAVRYRVDSGNVTKENIKSIKLRN